ncbi:DNA primase small subunit [uncultured archaeon]|nr:DNA primase small subunit [uncultured archaeon]
MTPAEIRAYYSRPEIAKRIFEMCKDREVVPVFLGGIYGTRPNSVQFPGDIIHFVKNGAVAFHCSVEHWKNPQMLSNDLKRADLDKLRTGWDLVLDIDSDAGIDAAKITAKLLIEEMRKNGVKNISVKFSGRRGFHIGVASGAFPKEVNLNDISKNFPEIPQKIAFYLCEKIKPELAKKLIALDPMLEERMRSDNAEERSIRDGATMKEVSGELNPYNVLDVEQNWSVRHLFRMPYAFNDKTWNVSLPFDPARIMEFSPDEAKPQDVKGDIEFLQKFEENECEMLVRNALEFAVEMKPKSAILKGKKDEKKEGLMRAIYEDGVMISDSRPEATQEELGEIMRSGASKEPKAFSAHNIKVPEENFPPCIKKILGGIADGRKRAVFILINFLRTSGYNWDEIDEKLAAWNEKNPEQLPEAYWKGQLGYAKTHEIPEQNKLPPNCDNAGYYKDIKICAPDGICDKIKNPVSYGTRKMLMDKARGINNRRKPS